MKRIIIRVAVAVDPKGRWYAYGTNTGPNNHDELLEVTDFDVVGPNEALFWVTAELAIPEVSEVAGEATAA